MAADVELERLHALVERSPLLPDPSLRRHWVRVIAWLPQAARYELWEILGEFDAVTLEP
jgi:hypothetical protein